jgi:hypothetical protein
MQTSTNLIIFLGKGNPGETILDSEKTTEVCAPCMDSFFSLKEQIMNLDNTVLVEGNKSDAPPTNDQELLD